MERDKKILLAYKMLRKKFNKSDPILANFKAVMKISQDFKLPYLTVSSMIREWRSQGKV